MKIISTSFNAGCALYVVTAQGTLVSTTAAPDVKIDIDYQERESGAHHDLMRIKPIDAVEKPDPGSEPAEVPCMLPLSAQGLTSLSNSCQRY